MPVYWSLDFPPPTKIQELQIRFASQLHAYPGLTTDFLFLNTRVPPFNNPSARRALNLAIDRARIVNQLGGPAYASPTCQLLPPKSQASGPTAPTRPTPAKAARGLLPTWPRPSDWWPHPARKE